ncbi:MAG: peptidase S49 [Rhodobacterales bacterium]|nr:MAG: peptidase S49 [Rhodobacterales bacterium]
MKASDHISGLLALSREHAAACLAAEFEASDDRMTAADGAGRYVVSGAVAVVPLRGIITPNNAILEKYLGWTTSHGLAETMETLSSDRSVAAIVVESDSPGGVVLGGEAAVQAVSMAAKVKPVHALVNPLSASLAYWIASQATDIAMTPGSLVGSIGAMFSAPSPVQPGVSGDQWFDMRSSHAVGKNADPADETGAALIQARLDDIEARFHRDVSAGRGIDLADLPTRLSADTDPTHGGGVFETAQAVERGLVDQVETRSAFYQRIMAAYAPKSKPTSRALSATAKARAATLIAG